MACQGSPSNPGLPGAYDAGSIGPGGGGGGGTSADGSVREARAGDHYAPTDGKTLETGTKDTGAVLDTGVPPPCAGCTVLWSDTVLSPRSLALDPTNVYWTQGSYSTGAPVPGTGSVRSVQRGTTGSGPFATIYGGDTGPQIVKVLFVGAISYVTWSSVEASAGTGMVFLQAFGTTAPGTSLTAPFGVAIDSANVYWVSSAGSGAAVQAAGVSSGTATTLGTVTGGFLPMGMAVNATSIYFVAQLSGGGGGLFELPIAGATPTEIWTGDATSAPVDVAVDDTNVYWTNQGDGAVYTMPLAGGPVTTLASKTTTPGLTGPARIAVDKNNVYFSDPTGMGLYEVPTGAGTVKTLVSPSKGLAILGVAADDVDSNVYFSDATEILSIPK